MLCTVLRLVVVLLLHSIEEGGNLNAESAWDAVGAPHHNETRYGFGLGAQDFVVSGFEAFASGFVGAVACAALSLSIMPQIPLCK